MNESSAMIPAEHGTSATEAATLDLLLEAGEAEAKVSELKGPSQPTLEDTPFAVNPYSMLHMKAATQDLV